MKVINYIRLANLFSHKDTRIDFEEGKNYIVGSIGKGKTLVLEGISFALFGSVALRGKATMYKGASVELSFNYKGETFLINRKINDASLSLLNKEINQYEVVCTSTTTVNQNIINLLGYTYDVYLLSNYCKQKKLSYFSELTPANRHSYIDKISGLDEANKLLGFINTQRKLVNSQLTTIKDMVVKPTLSSEVDLEFDYEAHIKEINKTLNSITDLYKAHAEAESNVIANQPVQPEINLTEVETLLNKYDDKEIILNTVKAIKELLLSSDIITNKIQDLPKIKSSYKSLTTDQVNHEIHKHNMQFVDHLPDGFSINCPHCKQDLILSDVLNKDNNEKPTIPIKDLYNIKEYIEKDIKNVERQLNKESKNIDDEIERLSDKIDSKFLRLLPEIIESSIKTLELKLKDFDLVLDNYFVQLDEFKEIKGVAYNLKQEINRFLLEQEDLITTKDKYVSLNTEKSIYLDKLSIYNTAIDKYNVLKEELDLFVKLRKSVNSIVTNIQNNIIPLIDYHASIFIDLITKGSMSKIEITDNYDILVDGVSISLKSGGQQDLASLAFRLSLGQSVVTGMLPLFIGDEIDSAGTSDVSDDITTALDSISNNGFQVILITHQDISTIENANIIQL